MGYSQDDWADLPDVFVDSDFVAYIFFEKDEQFSYFFEKIRARQPMNYLVFHRGVDQIGGVFRSLALLSVLPLLLHIGSLWVTDRVGILPVKPFREIS